MTKLVKRMATVAILGLTMAAPAVAQLEWHPDHVLPPGLPNPNMPWDGRKRQPARRGGGSVSGFGDVVTPVQVNAILINPTKWFVVYSVNGAPRTFIGSNEIKYLHFEGTTDNPPKIHIRWWTGDRDVNVDRYLFDRHTYHFVDHGDWIDLGN